ncbi:hypothetical protein [Rhizobium sp. CB3171]|uniref:hypothetical protein n=1 Tax=Rhizobium sp. CB3171 TaxID=3039157 RepID=UPI0032C21EE6
MVAKKTAYATLQRLPVQKRGPVRQQISRHHQRDHVARLNQAFVHLSGVKDEQIPRRFYGLSRDPSTQKSTTHHQGEPKKILTVGPYVPPGSIDFISRRPGLVEPPSPGQDKRIESSAGCFGVERNGIIAPQDAIAVIVSDPSVKPIFFRKVERRETEHQRGICLRH